MSSDEYFMELALREAQKAYALNEVPVGAVVVYNNEVIARAHNLVETKQDATAHAEMLCLSEAAKLIGNWRLLGATLYCTLEPCSMCAGAMLLSRVQALVWGAPDMRHGAHGSWVNILDQRHPIHCLEVRRGVLAEPCGNLLKSFFRMRRSSERDNRLNG